MFRKKTEPADAIQQKIKKKSLWSYKVYLVYVSFLFISLIPVFFTDDLRLLITKAFYLPVLNMDVPFKDYVIWGFLIAVVLLAYLKYCLMDVLKLLRSLPQNNSDENKTPVALWLDAISQSAWRRQLTLASLMFGLPTLMMFFSVWTVRAVDMDISYPLTVLVVLSLVAVILFWYVPRKYRAYKPSSTPLDSIRLKRSSEANLRYMAKMESSTNIWKALLTAIVIVFVVWFHGSFFDQAERGEVFAYDLSYRDVEQYFTDLNRDERWKLNKLPMHNSNFEGANLSGIQFYGAKLQGANFHLARLVDADLSHAHLHYANFTQAVLTSAKIWGTHLENTNFAFADLRSLDGVSLKVNGVNFEDADLSFSKLISAVFQDTSFKNATMQKVVFPRNRFITVDFSGADLEGADLRESWTNLSDFTEANFKNSNLHKMRFFNSNFTNVDFANANLTEAHFESANLNGASFSGANLAGASLYKLNEDGSISNISYNIEPSQFYDVESLYQAALPPEIEASLLETHPHLFEPLEEVQE